MFGSGLELEETDIWNKEKKSFFFSLLIKDHIRVRHRIFIRSSHCVVGSWSQLNLLRFCELDQYLDFF